MSAARIEKCCGKCGRWGVRGYRESYSSDGVSTAHSKWVCENDAACGRRARRVLSSPTPGSEGDARE